MGVHWGDCLESIVLLQRGEMKGTDQKTRRYKGADANLKIRHYRVNGARLGRRVARLPGYGQGIMKWWPSFLSEECFCNSSRAVLPQRARNGRKFSSRDWKVWCG